VLPFGQLWYTQVSDAVDYAKFYSRSYDAVIGGHDDGGNVIETHEPTGDFKARGGAKQNEEPPHG
jgi:hypothetical protein